MNRREDALLDVAEAVADGSPVNWKDQLRRSPDRADQLEQLQSIERVAIAFRGSDTVASAGDTPHGRPPSRWGALEILEKLGEGTFGEVYRAHDPGLQRDVALKLLRTSRSNNVREEKRFVNEAHKLARVRHENVLTVHGAGRHDGRSGLWTDLIDGRTLEECLNEQGPLGAREACLVGIDLCHALAAVHGAGLVHQDVKTANVMRESGGRIVLMDFSAVRDRFDAEHDTGERMISGTPLFMAPELFRGIEPDVTADLYSLGVVLYRLVSGEFPVGAGGVAELVRKHQNRESIPLRDVRPDLPVAFVKVVERALAKEPEGRFSTAGEFEQALTQALGAEAPSPPPRPWWRAWPAAAVAAIVVVAVTAIVILPPILAPDFEIETSLYRNGMASDERLAEGANVLPGDRLFLEIEGTREMYVYVLNSDNAGNVFVLFPIVGLDTDNPLPPEATHRLPGTIEGTKKYWEVDSAGGQETFLVIASPEPLDEVEQRLESLPHAGEPGPIRLNSNAIEGLRGIGGLVSGSQSKEQPLSAVYDSLNQYVAQDSDIRVWRTRLNNPAD